MVSCSHIGVPMVSSSATVTAHFLVYDANLQLYKQLASAPWFPASLSGHLAAFACLDKCKRDQVVRESSELLSCEMQISHPIALLDSQGGQIQPSFDFQLFPFPPFNTTPDGSDSTNWANQQDSRIKSTRSQDLTDPDIWMTDRTNSPPIHGEHSSVSMTETVPETFVFEGSPACSEISVVKETHEDQELQPDLALSYPTPASNPPKSPRLANEELEKPCILQSRELEHAVPRSSAISKPISLEGTSANQVGIYPNCQAAVLAPMGTVNDTKMRFSADICDRTFQGDSMLPEPAFGFSLMTKSSDSLTVEDAERLSQQESIVRAQRAPSGQFSDGSLKNSAGPHYMPSSGSQALAMIQSAYSTGTNNTLTDLQMEKVIEVANSALVLDHKSVVELFTVNTSSWLLNESKGRHALGIPLPSFESNKAACVTYYKALEFGFGPKKDANSLPYLLSRRVMQIWQHLFFDKYVEDLKREEAAGSVIERNGRQLKTVARDSILADVYGSEYRQQQRYRAKHQEHERWGHRWWRIASCDGTGVVLLASKELAENIGKNTAFHEPMVDALIIYLLNAYPAVVSLFRLLGPITESLMVGKGFSCFEEAEIIGLLDQVTRPDLHIEVFPKALHAINPRLVSASVAPQFMKRNSQNLEAAGSFGSTVDSE